jgi:hypothetical protein
MLLFFVQRGINVCIPTSGYGQGSLPHFETRFFQFNFVIAWRQFEGQRRAAHVLVVNRDVCSLWSGFHINRSNRRIQNPVRECRVDRQRPLPVA